MQDLVLEAYSGGGGGGWGGVCVFHGFFYIGYNEIEYLVL